MANITETDVWSEGIYQIEEYDPVLGGADGIANKQAKQLAARTRWLKKKLEAAGVSVVQFNQLLEAVYSSAGLDKNGEEFNPDWLMDSINLLTKPFALKADVGSAIQIYPSTPLTKQKDVIYVIGAGLMFWNGTGYVDAAIYPKFSDFTSQKSTSGYQMLPGGLILQWVSMLVNNNQPCKVNLPIVFPNKLLNVQVSNSYMNNPAMAGSGDNYFQVQQYDNESVTVFLQYFGGVGLYPAYAEILTIGC